MAGIVHTMLKNDIFPPSWRPSWISQNAQGCQVGTRWILYWQGLSFKNQQRKKLYTVFPGLSRILPDSPAE